MSKNPSPSETPKNKEDKAMQPLERKHLLALVAGNVAVGLLGEPSQNVDTPDKMATVAVDIAEAILTRAGL